MDYVFLTVHVAFKIMHLKFCDIRLRLLKVHKIMHLKFCDTFFELHSGSKSCRAEPHNYRARIEIEKTMRLSFHGHRG